MFARWKNSPPNCTNRYGCCAARSAANTATASAARRSLPSQYGPLVNVFRELKRIFDPQRLAEPRQDRAGRADANHAAHAAEPAIGAQHALADRELNRRPSRTASRNDRSNCSSAWTEAEMAAAATSCNGCGACRATSPEVRMCPIIRMNPREEASPRAKANLVRGLLAGQLPDDTLLQDACKEVADLCVHCHMCRLECPANVDIPEAHAGSQGRLREHERPKAARMVLDAHRHAGRARRPPAGHRELGDRQSASPLAARKSDRHRPSPQAAALRSPQLPAAVGACGDSTIRRARPAKRSSTSSIPTPTTSTPNSAKHWSP